MNTRQSAIDISNLSFTGRIAGWSARHRWRVVAASIMVIVLAMFVSGTVETKLLDESEFAEGESGDGSSAPGGTVR